MSERWAVTNGKLQELRSLCDVAFSETEEGTDKWMMPAFYARQIADLLNALDDEEAELGKEHGD